MPALHSRTQEWHIFSTPPLPGRENMAIDVETVTNVARGLQGPTLRFFRWAEPTVSHGRLQKAEGIAALVPPGWNAVQRPTGGGVVFHQDDLCLSLAWKLGDLAMPKAIKDVYPAIHRVIQKALRPLVESSLATCKDCASAPSAFASRQCFAEPVAFDLLSKGEKLVGGALAHRGQALLYQGSIQGLTDSQLEPRLAEAFSNHFQTALA